MENRYYVYALIRTDSNSIFYIGKGTGSRHRSHRWAINSGNHRNIHITRLVKELWKDNHDFISKILINNLDEDMAFSYETNLILTYRTNGFELCNIGIGKSGCSGRKISKEQSLKQSKRMLGNKYMFGKKMSKESSDKKSKALKKYKRNKSIFCENDILFIRNCNEPSSSVAKKFGVNRATIVDIRNGRTWSDVGGRIWDSSDMKKEMIRNSPNNGKSSRKISEENILHIRNSIESNKHLANLFGVKSQTIIKIRKGLSYREFGGKIWTNEEIRNFRSEATTNFNNSRDYTIMAKTLSETKKQLGSRGLINGRGILSYQDVIDIRDSSLSTNDLCIKYKLTKSAIYRIKRKESYRWVK